MITVQFSDDNGVKALTVEGHAEYAERGKDIVCAGVSTIAQTLLGFLEYSDVDVDSQVSESSGYMHITAESSNTVADIAFQMAYVGMKQIEQTYPSHIEVYVADKECESLL